MSQLTAGALAGQALEPRLAGRGQAPALLLALALPALGLIGLAASRTAAMLGPRVQARITAARPAASEDGPALRLDYAYQLAGQSYVGEALASAEEGLAPGGALEVAVSPFSPGASRLARDWPALLALWAGALAWAGAALSLARRPTLAG